MTVVVESNVLKDSKLEMEPIFREFKDSLITFDSEEDVGRDDVDLIICLGGDGTLLYASSLFQVNSEHFIEKTLVNSSDSRTYQRKVPPVMAFHMGSLGFLAPFEFDSFCNEVSKVLEGDPCSAYFWEIRDLLKIFRQSSSDCSLAPLLHCPKEGPKRPGILSFGSE